MRRYCVFMDGGFVKKKLRSTLGTRPQAADVIQFTNALKQHPALVDSELLRAYWYDAEPYTKSKRTPLGGTLVAYGSTVQAKENRTLLEMLELESDFAVRRGELALHGWRLAKSAFKLRKQNPALPLTHTDLVPDFKQKGVDMRIGLDIARVALRRTADILVLVTGDSDFVPAMKLARIEGLRVYVDVMGHGVSRALKVHADLVL